MARIIVQYPLQDLGMHQRAVEECRGHGYDAGWRKGTDTVGPTKGNSSQVISQAILM